jgi:hypothetical protein
VYISRIPRIHAAAQRTGQDICKGPATGHARGSACDSAAAVQQLTGLTCCSGALWAVPAYVGCAPGFELITLVVCWVAAAGPPQMYFRNDFVPVPQAEVALQQHTADVE